MASRALRRIASFPHAGDDFHKHLTLQTFYTVRALEEEGVTFSTPDRPERGWGVPECNHYNGTCRFIGAPNPARQRRLNDTTYSLLFPHYMLREIVPMRCPERARAGYYFRGLSRGSISRSRKALLEEYRGRNDTRIELSYRGRMPSVKYTLDRDYLRSLCCAKFALAPSNDCPWSYRFFEAIMCNAIPVLHDGDGDIFAKHFHHLRSGQASAHSYDAMKAHANMRTLERWHMLPGAAERYRRGISGRRGAVTPWRYSPTTVGMRHPNT
jgi:hypothetical protein